MSIRHGGEFLMGFFLVFLAVAVPATFEVLPRVVELVYGRCCCWCGVGARLSPVSPVATPEEK